MTEDEIDEVYEKNLRFMAKVVPPDDIYGFAEGAIIMATFFLKKWAEYADIREEANVDNIAQIYVSCLLNYLDARSEDDK